MGSAFFRDRELGPAAGSNSTIGRAAQNDPVSDFLFGAPKMVLPTAGPYAGATPTLAAAQNGYALNSKGAMDPTGGVSAQLQATGLGNQLAPAAKVQSPVSTPTTRPAAGVM